MKEQKDVIYFVGKSKRLTNLAKEELLDILVTNAFRKKQEVLNIFKDTFAEKLYQEFTVKPYQKVMDTLDDEWKSKSYYISTHVRGNYGWENFYFHKDDKDGRGDRVQKWFPRVKSSTDSIEIPNEHKLAIELEKYKQKKSKLAEKMKEVKTKTKAALNDINTTKQLFELWPEAYAEYLKICKDEDSSMHLPDIPRDNLNEMLGL